MSIAQIQRDIEKACKRIAPAWPLENSVAVNPYLGLSDMTFEKAAETLKNRGDIHLYMPLNFYLKQIKEGKISKVDLEKTLGKKYQNISEEEFLQHLNYLKDKGTDDNKMINVLDVTKNHEKIDASEIMINHTSEWLASYFNSSDKISPESMFQQWRAETQIDILPELSGLKGFRNTIKDIPDNAISTIHFGLKKLNIPNRLVEIYLHSLLLKLIGWSSYSTGLDWQNKLYGEDTNYLKTLLSILITWEVSLINSFNRIDAEWKKTVDQLENSLIVHRSNQYLIAQSILQDAFDYSFQRKLRDKFNSHAKASTTIIEEVPEAQMVFCIDVRSEVYRRNLETVNKNIETIGFAGFFGFPIKYNPINHEKGKNQCPVLIPSGPKVYETTPKKEDLKKVQKSLLRKGSLDLAWSKFKSGAVSSYSFVSPLGLFYLPKLISDSFGWTSPVKNPKQKEFGHIISGKRKLDVTKIPFEDRVNMAKGALKAMGLKEQFAPLVLITGHGSSSVNNPHASGLDCGACGGNSGEINAITAQLILNDDQIREELIKESINIPADTYFVACLHDTTTDEISILDESNIPEVHAKKLQEIKPSLVKASQASRKARAQRFGINQKSAEASILKRANDWAQVRPEWGLAGCSSFIVAPRKRTRGIDLEGKAFLHSYDWKPDQDFNILETIMTAPMIVTSWINLQYYASTVDNKRLGAGNKTLHNVTGGMGVLEGAKGDLRIGLPWQSVHDGKDYQHLPLRLNVVIEAPKEAVNEIIQKHTNIQELCDHRWISIMILNEEGILSHRYDGNNQWEQFSNKENENKIEKVEFLVETI